MKIHELKTLTSHRFFKAAIPLLIASSLLPYFLSLGNGFVSDDVGGILKNPAIGQFSTVLSEPLNGIQNLLNFLVYKLFGLSPFYFRLPSLLFHTGTVLSLFLAVALLCGIEIGFLSALVFAVHPLGSEAVVWISAASYPRYAFFLMSSFASYLLSLSAKEKDKKVRWYTISFLFFLFGLFSSEKAVIFSLVIFAFHLADKSVKIHLKNLTPFFVGTLVFMIPHLFNVGGRITDTKLEYGAQSQIFFNPLLQIPVALSTYLTLIFWPDKLDFFHANLVLSPLSIVITLTYLSAVAISFFKNRLVFFWLLFFFIVLTPTLLPFRIASTVAERYAYLAMAGIITATITSFLLIAKKMRFSSYLVGVLVILLFVLGARTMVRSLDWKTEDTLALAGSRTSPDTLNNHLNLANLYAKQGRYEDAVRELHATLAIEPSYAKAYNNLGYVYAQMGQFNEAMKAYQAGLKVNPTMWEIHDNLAGLYTALKMYDKALEHEQLAMQYSKNNIDLYLHLGIIYMQMDDRAKAKEAFRKVLGFDPKNSQAQELLKDLSAGP